MAVRPIQSRFCGFKSTPAIRAMTAPSPRAASRDYPCRCLCFGLAQITRTTPRRFTILHLSQIFLTDDRTFIPCLRSSAREHFAESKRLSFETIDDSPARQVVRRQFPLHPVARQDANKVLPHLARDMRQHLVLVLELHPEHRVGERLDDRGHHFDGILFGIAVVRLLFVFRPFRHVLPPASSTARPLVSCYRILVTRSSVLKPSFTRRVR